MGLLEDLMSGIYGAASLHPQQLAAMQQQFQPNPVQAQYMYEAMRPSQPYQPLRKHVESREVTPRERARKQINGAVQAVKDAQIRG